MPWSTHPYIRLRQGFVYLVAVMDWFSRYVLAWEISTTMETLFCVSALDWALRQGMPEIFNSDQGAQFTSLEFTGRLSAAGIRISMDGRGRAFDNIFVERLWRTVKYENVYLNEYESVPMLTEGLARYFAFYNEERIHQSLRYRTPKSVHFGQSWNRRAGVPARPSGCQALSPPKACRFPALGSERAWQSEGNLSNKLWRDSTLIHPDFCLDNGVHLRDSNPVSIQDWYSAGFKGGAKLKFRKGPNQSTEITLRTSAAKSERATFG